VKTCPILPLGMSINPIAKMWKSASKKIRQTILQTLSLSTGSIGQRPNLPFERSSTKTPRPDTSSGSLENSPFAAMGRISQTRTTALEEKASFLIAETIKGGQIVSISILIEDWQGAGGMFRPIRLSTRAHGKPH
jgi:hypothetical protein